MNLKWPQVKTYYQKHLPPTTDVKFFGGSTFEFYINDILKFVDIFRLYNSSISFFLIKIVHCLGFICMFERYKMRICPGSISNDIFWKRWVGILKLIFSDSCPRRSNSISLGKQVDTT
jgi:hypothetical protein